MQGCTTVLSSQAILFDGGLFMYLWSEGIKQALLSVSLKKTIIVSHRSNNFHYFYGYVALQ